MFSHKKPARAPNALTLARPHTRTGSGSPAPVHTHEESPPTARAGGRTHVRSGRPLALEQTRHVSRRPRTCATPDARRGSEPTEGRPGRTDGTATPAGASPRDDGSSGTRADAQPNAGEEQKGAYSPQLTHLFLRASRGLALGKSAPVARREASCRQKPHTSSRGSPSRVSRCSARSLRSRSASVGCRVSRFCHTRRTFKYEAAARPGVT